MEFTDAEGEGGGRKGSGDVIVCGIHNDEGGETEKVEWGWGGGDGRGDGGRGDEVGGGGI